MPLEKTFHIKNLHTQIDHQILVIEGDITQIPVDAIVNAANSTLLGGGGVDGAIHRYGGPEILAQCKKLRETQYPDGLPAGEAVATTAGILPAKHVIHAVGPVWYGRVEQESSLLESCYRNCLRVAVGLGCSSLSFPAISTGIFHFPKPLAARVATTTIMNLLTADPKADNSFEIPSMLIHFVLFGKLDFDLFLQNSVLK